MYTPTLAFNRKYNTIPNRITNLFRQTTKVQLADRLQLGNRTSQVFKFFKNIASSRSREQYTSKTEDIANAISFHGLEVRGSVF